ncbi:MAG: hypothetical protein KAT68_01355 [Bacteroidales bacterium]|nr:hypothetical protein [Bacteroidales bacterium]
MQKKENEILVDVVIRYCVHEQYGNFDKAVVALKKRLLYFDDNAVRNLLKIHIDIFEYSRNFVLKAMKKSHVKSTTLDKVIKEISERFQCDNEIISSYLNFCHYYYILK